MTKDEIIEKLESKIKLNTYLMSITIGAKYSYYLGKQEEIFELLEDIKNLKD